MKRPLLLSLAILAIVLIPGIPAVLAFTGMEVVSVGPGGAPGDGGSFCPSISDDGRYVSFHSAATNLVSPATSGTQVFVRDRQTGATALVSVGTGGAPGYGDSFNPSISADGRYVAFMSEATNLVSPPTSGTQVFVRDRQNGATTLVSAGPGGAPGDGYSANPSISADGRYIAFWSEATNLVSPATSVPQVFVRDRQAGATALVSVGTGGAPGNGPSQKPSISEDGRYVAFLSYATNLVSQPTSGDQVFVRDRQAGATMLASVGPDGAPGDGDSSWPSISADGRYVAFLSYATNLVSPATSGPQVFVRDRQAGATALASVGPGGAPGDGGSYYPSISADGRYVAFESEAANLVSPATSGWQVFVTGSPYTPDTRTITATAGANGSISPSGRVKVNVGASQAFAITANAGYRVADVLVDGDSIGAVSTYTFTNVAADHTISASFARAMIGAGPGSSGYLSAPPAPQGPMNLANVKVTSAAVSASRVRPGEIITVTANVANQGTGNGSMLVKLYVNGQAEASQGIAVNSGSNVPVTFTLSRNEPGVYSVYVGGVSAGSFTVESDSDIILYISIAMVFIALAAGAVYFTGRRHAV